MRAALTAWYNKHIAARWWASSAMWVGIAAGAVEYLPDYLQLALDQVDLLGGVFVLEDSTKRLMQAVLLFVVLPMAKAWKQQKSTIAALKQAAENGQVTSAPNTDAVVVRSSSGAPVAIVRPADTVRANPSV
jgi:hypothetical protein